MRRKNAYFGTFSIRTYRKFSVNVLWGCSRSQSRVTRSRFRATAVRNHLRVRRRVAANFHLRCVYEQLFLVLDIVVSWWSLWVHVLPADSYAYMWVSFQRRTHLTCSGIQKCDPHRRSRYTHINCIKVNTQWLRTKSNTENNMSVFIITEHV